VKSNSLGVILAAEYHDYFGPAPFHWEGGYRSERKIQEVKPLLGIRRANVNWQSLVLRRLYQQECIDRLLSDTDGRSDEEQAAESHAAEGLFYIYKSKMAATEAIKKCEPLSAISANGKLYLVFRPSGDERVVGSTRSSVHLLEVRFKDMEGDDICGCWVAPIEISGLTVSGLFIESQFLDAVKHCILMLPVIESGKKNNGFMNSFYAIGDDWTERIPSGEFVSSSIHQDMFTEWLSDAR
jgi:hypothetical protein